MTLTQYNVLAISTLGIVLGTLAMAETVAIDNGRMTYEVFEHSIEHADLAGCPEGVDTDIHFCRLTLADDRAHVFVFALEGDQPLVALHAYGLDEGLPRF